MTTNPTGSAALPLAERALGPDLARGMMLLFIALANSHYFVVGTSGEYFGGFPLYESWIDSATAWLISTFVDGRAFPMFGLLFGYGVAQIVRRHAARGPRGVRRLLWRRSAMLVLIGFLHALLLFEGDILTAYGVLLAFGAWMVGWRDRWLWVAAMAFLLLMSMPSLDGFSIGLWAPDEALLPPDLATQVTERAWVSAYVGLLGPLGFVTPFAVGLWAGRRRILERPAEHRAMLTATAVMGIAVAALAAQPVALVHLGVYDVPSADVRELIGPLHDVSGYFGGAGYAAAIALLSLRIRTPLGRVTQAVAATGQRSMTCYLAQSLVWAVVFTPYLLDLSETLTTTTTALLATVTWGATVALGDWMRRTGRRGPFETLMRRVAYRNPR